MRLQLYRFIIFGEKNICSSPLGREFVKGMIDNLNETNDSIYFSLVNNENK